MTADQSALLEKARDNIRIARVTASEGVHRAAVSLAYYAMFYVTEALMLGDGLAFSKHSAVIAAFGQHFARPGRVPADLHRHLIDAFKARGSADYDIHTAFGEADALLQIARAQEFLDFAEDLLGPLPEPEPETPQ